MPILCFSPTLKFFNTDRAPSTKPPNNTQIKPRKLFKRLTGSNRHCRTGMSAEDDVNGEDAEILAPRPMNAPLGFGSNSVHFPDSHEVSTDTMDLHPPNTLTSMSIAIPRSSSMDINRAESVDKVGKYLHRHSTDLHRLKLDHHSSSPNMLQTLVEQSGSTALDSISSYNEHSLLSVDQFLAKTSLASTASAPFNNALENGCAFHNVGSNVASPRTRHTKLLGGPPPLNRPHTLSASSMSSLNSFVTSDFNNRPSHQILTNYSSGAAHHLDRVSTASLNNLVGLSRVPRHSPDDECEQLTSELISSLNTGLNFHSPLVDHRLPPSHAPRAPRQKVPLDEVIGKSSMSTLRPSPSLELSHSQSPPPLSAMRSHPVMMDFAKCAASHTNRVTAAVTDRPLSRTDNDSVTGSSTTTNTSSHMGPRHAVSHDPILQRWQPRADQTSQGVPLLPPTSLSEPPNNTHHTIEEVDEEAADMSYELLERPSIDASPVPEWQKKRKRGIIHNYRDLRLGHSTNSRLGHSSNSTNDILSKKLIKPSPSHPKPNQKIKVMQKLGLLGPSSVDPHLSEPATSDDDVRIGAEDVTPKKKIRVLENEVQRLKRELESERLRHSQELHRSMKLNATLLKRSTKTNSQAFNSPLSSEVSRVRFSPKSAWSSSPASVSRFRRFRSSTQSHSKHDALSGTPVLIKKPSEGAMIGGSPFVVSRVYGQGPEVIGEKTPEAARKRHFQRKPLAASSSTLRLPGLAQDLFGAGLSSAPTGTANVSLNPFKASVPLQAPRWKGKDRQVEAGSATSQPMQSADQQAGGWVRDSELEKDLFGEETTQQPRRHSMSLSTRVVASDSSLAVCSCYFLITFLIETHLSLACSGVPTLDIGLYLQT